MVKKAIMDMVSDNDDSDSVFVQLKDFVIKYYNVLEPKAL
jgi:hypothetical protein